MNWYKIGMIFILILAIIEVSILGMAYFGADEVECNFLWCTFKTTHNMQDSIIIETHQKCFLNGYEIDCNDNRTNLPKIPTSGNFDNIPILKTDKNWKDVLQTFGD